MAQDVERNGCAADDADYGCYDDSNPLHLDIYNDGITAGAEKMLDVIAGKDNGAGVFGCPELEKVRRWILANR